MQTNILTPQELFFKIIRYEIPVFQRPYIWTQEDQWEPLWEDVRDIAEDILENGNTARHFMGAIVLQQRFNAMPSIETRIVVDGQQRLTTLQLLIDGVQETLEQATYSGPARRLDSLVRTDEAFRGNDPDLAFKVWPTAADQAAFRHAMNNELSSDAYKNSRIVAAHSYFKNAAADWLAVFPEDDGQRNDAAEALENSVRNYLELVVINLDPPDDPHIIFETLNARGTPLLPSDMIKNQILHRAGVMNEYQGEADPQESESLWPFSDPWWRIEIGRGHQRRPRIDSFLNNWLTLRNGSETKNNDEFATFSRYATQAEANGTSIDSVAADISELGQIYRDISELKVEEIEPFLYRRNVMGVGVIIPTLLWLLSSGVPKDQLLKSATALESYLVRRMICGMSARSYGQLFMGLISELDSSAQPEDTAQTVIRYLRRQNAYANVWPDDATLRERFVSEPLYWSLTSGRLNLVLQGIEGAMHTPWSETQRVPRNLHIEHIMPQSWYGTDWPLPDETIDAEAATIHRDRTIHSIGNLTLVTQPLNSHLSNLSWKNKRESLEEHTVLFLNSELIRKAPNVWDETAIVDRAKRLFTAAIKAWPHADGMA